MFVRLSFVIILAALAFVEPNIDALGLDHMRPEELRLPASIKLNGTLSQMKVNNADPNMVLVTLIFPNCIASIDANKSEIVWKKCFDFGGIIPDFQSSLKSVFVIYSTNVFCLNALTGAEIWKSVVSNDSSISLYEMALGLSGSEQAPVKTLYVVLHQEYANATIQALAESSGKLLWQVKFAQWYTMFYASTNSKQPGIIVATNDDNHVSQYFVYVDGTGQKKARFTSTEIIHQSLNWQFSFVTDTFKFVEINADMYKNSITALDPLKNFTTLWKIEASEDMQFRNFFYFEDKLQILTVAYNKSYFVTLQLIHVMTKEIIWSRGMSGGLFPIVMNNNIFWTSVEKSINPILVFDLLTGDFRAQYETEAYVYLEAVTPTNIIVTEHFGTLEFIRYSCSHSC